jgi:hypothetical protein
MWNPLTGFMSWEVAAIVAVVGGAAWLLSDWLN